MGAAEKPKAKAKAKAGKGKGKAKGKGKTKEAGRAAPLKKGEEGGAILAYMNEQNRPYTSQQVRVQPWEKRFDCTAVVECVCMCCCVLGAIALGVLCVMFCRVCSCIMHVLLRSVVLSCVLLV